MKKLEAAAVALVFVAILVVVFVPRTIRTISLHRAENRWNDASVDNYTWSIDTGCFGACTNGTPIVIVVRDGKPVHVSGRRAAPIEGTPMTVERLFRSVGREVGADAYAVAFDPELGFPTEGHFDPSRGSQDDEWGFTVAGLHRD